MQNKPIWGIDLGGTKIEIAILKDFDNEPILRKRCGTEAEHGYAHILGQIERLVASAVEETGLGRPSKIGIGTPGIADPRSKLMKNCNTVCLNGQPLHSDLENILGCEIAMANDANCFALAEALMGAGRGAEVVFGVILGTGVGGGVVVRGQVINGLHGIGGEWGHNQFSPDAPDCYCGHKGCIEKVLAGPALENWYFEQTGERLSLKEIAASGRKEARDTMDRLCTGLGRMLGTVVNLIDPNVIILGGGVGQIDEIYDRVPAELAKHVFNDYCETPIVKPMLGDSAGVFGAALLAR